MFRGSSTHKLDPKGRISIPARFRTVLDEEECGGLIISRMDKGLLAYTYRGWIKIEERILALSEKNEAIRRFRRVFIGGAHDCPLDKQSRILIPPSLRTYAELEKEIVLVGVLDHFEIISEKRWEEENRLLEEEMQSKEELRNEIAKLGI